jgi:acetyltransferase-like isoleucine patch superfamily enzyme
MQIHETSDVQTNNIGEGTKIWQFSVVLSGAKIGKNCNINAHCFIENDVVIGNNVTIKSGVYLWDGVRVEDDVFIGPNVTFNNDIYPRSKQYPARFSQTLLRKGSSIGGGAVLLPGVEIGERALIGAGSVVTKNIPAAVIVVGNPAHVIGTIKD